MITHDTFNDKSNITIDYIFFFFSVFFTINYRTCDFRILSNSGILLNGVTYPLMKEHPFRTQECPFPIS